MARVAALVALEFMSSTCAALPPPERVRRIGGCHAISRPARAEDFPILETNPDRWGRWDCVARGATDDKGQSYAHLKAVEAILAERGRLPVNVKLIVEGEEESGGAAIEAYVRHHRLHFVDDDSNAQPRFARNRLRRRGLR